MKRFISTILALSLTVQALPVFAADYHATIEYIAGGVGESDTVKVTADEELQNVSFVAAQSADGKLTDGNIFSIDKISPEEPYTFYATNENADQKFMLWQDSDNMQPLAEEVFYKKDTAETDKYTTGEAGGVKVETEGELNDISPTIEYITIENTAETGEANCIAAVEVSLRDGEELKGVAEIRIKYDENKEYTAANLIAGYFNPEINQWEVPCYYLDEVAHEAVIITDHFSKYGLFEVDNSGTPNAFARPLEASQVAQMMFFSSSTLQAIFNNEVPPSQDEAAAMILEALDGSFNGKVTATGNNINTILTKGGKISGGVLGKIGTQYTIIGVVGGMINTANAAYKHGTFSYNTLEALGRTAIAAGVSAASSPVQICMLIYGLGEMSYNHVQEKKLTKAHEELKGLQKDYMRIYVGQRTATDWYNVLEPVYNKYCSDMTDANIVDKYADFDRTVKRLVRAYAYDFATEYRSGNLYGKFLQIPPYTEKYGELADDICANYEAETWGVLQSVLVQYSRKAELDAQRGLAKECEELRNLLNGEITLNFYVTASEMKDLAPNCYVRFYNAAQKDLWRRDFDANGKASITFSLLAYNQLECPTFITVFDKKTDRAVGRIELPDNMEPDHSYDVPFDPDTASYFINIHEVKEHAYDPYQFAGLNGRLAPSLDDMYKDRFAFTLDENGCAELEMDYAFYFDHGAPKWVEILSPSGKVVYRTPYDPSRFDVPLDGSTYSVEIKCADEKTAKRYGYRKTAIVYFENFEAEPTVVTEDSLSGSGGCTMMFPQYGYDFHDREYTLYIYDEQGEKPDQIFDLSDSFDKKNTTTEVELKLGEDDDDPDDEGFELDTNVLFMYPNTSTAVKAVSGVISEIESGDDGIVEIGADMSINAKETGRTYILVRDYKGSEIKLDVIVAENIYDYVNPICRGCQVYRMMNFQGRVNEAYFDPWSREDAMQPYARVTFATSKDAGGNGIAAITIREESGSMRYFRHIDGMDADKLYWSDYSGSNYRVQEYITDYDYDHFLYVVGEQITSDMYREMHYYYERTDYKDYPSSETADGQ